MQYYFLGSILPELQVGYPPDSNFEETQRLLQLNLLEHDFAKTRVIRSYYDIENIRAFWREIPLDPRGNYNENELEDALLVQAGLPDYVYTFMDQYENVKERLVHFPQLITQFFHEEIAQATGFLKDYLTFEREWRLVVAGFRAKKLGRDITFEMQYEDPSDELVAQIIAQKDARTYEPPVRYRELKVLFEEHEEDPFALHQAICEYRFQKIEEMYGVEVFSLERILGYLAQLIIVEKWLELDKKKGLEVIETIVKEAS